MIEVNKLQRYIFPKIDIIPNQNWYMKTRQPLAILSNLINLSLDNLNSQEYKFWSELCQRDVLFKEVSKNGHFCTNADIKKEISIFKKAHEKNEYIKSKQNNEIKIMLNIYP